MKSPITTHVLDTARGCPAAGVAAVLERKTGDGSFEELARGVTDDDGRITDLLPPGSLRAGTYRMTFAVGVYQDGGGFYPEVPVVFRVAAADQHYHVPLLLSPFGYSTYRGS